MMSVTQRIKMIIQPRNGYLNINSFKVEQYFDSIKLNEIPSHYKSLQELLVDYLVRYLSGSSKSAAFKISLKDANLVSKTEVAKELLEKIKVLDKGSVYNACKNAIKIRRRD